MLRTSEGAERLGTAEVVRRYKDLTRVERAFRSLKVHPTSSGRDQGPGSLLWAGLLRPLASLLFDDEELEAERAAVELPAQPSDSGRRQVHRGRVSEAPPAVG